MIEKCSHRLGIVNVALAAALTVLTVLWPQATASADTPLALPKTVYDALLAAESSTNVAVAVLDTESGQFYGSAADETPFPAESVVKVLIAARLLATGQLTGATEQMAYQMITESDDDDADALWGAVGGPDVLAWAQARYGIADLGTAPTQYGWWGNTKFTAHGLVQLYAAVKADPVVGPWLLDAMSHMSASAADGTDQDFGLAAQTTLGAFKQGWGGDDDADNSEQLNSTGLLDNDRYAVAVLVQHVPVEPMDALLPVIDTVAAAVAPAGEVVFPPSPGAASVPRQPGQVGTPPTGANTATATQNGQVSAQQARAGAATSAAGSWHPAWPFRSGGTSRIVVIAVVIAVMVLTGQTYRRWRRGRVRVSLSSNRAELRASQHRRRRRGSNSQQGC